MTKVCWYSGKRSVWFDRDKVSTDLGSEGAWFPSVNQTYKYTVSLSPPYNGLRIPTNMFSIFHSEHYKSKLLVHALVQVLKPK